MQQFKLGWPASILPVTTMHNIVKAKPDNEAEIWLSTISLAMG